MGETTYTKLPRLNWFDFGTNRKRVYNFLLVINSNLGPIVSEILQVFC